MNKLFPAIQPYVTHSLKIDDTHTLHVEECGNPSGLPAVFLHGGPGGGYQPNHRRYFDPDVYRIILFDQRGCGRSTPHASLENNTTQALIEDIEAIRVHLAIDAWVVFGGSWGSTLALVYAETHPQRVLGLILRGIFLCREQDIHWFYQEGASRVYPDHWENYAQTIPIAERDDMLRAYHKRLTGEDEVARMAAAKAWSIWEGQCSTLLPNQNVVDFFGEPYTALALARIESHFFVNQCFLAPNQILDEAHRLADIPGVIVHGRYDVVCPVDQAWDLHNAWPTADLQIISNAGHAVTEPGIIDALIHATKNMSRQLRDDG